MTNILCLTVGIFSFLLLINYNIYENNFDNFHKKYKNIYKILTYTYKGDEPELIMGTEPYPLPPFLKMQFNEVESFVRVRRASGNSISKFKISYKDQTFDEDNISFVDSTFLDVFSFKLLKGNPKYAFSMPNTVIITKSTEEKYFPNEDPINKMLRIKHNSGLYNWRIVGVIEDVPENTSLFFGGVIAPFISFKSIDPQSANPNSWGPHLTDSYLLLKDGVDPRVFENKFMKKVNEVSWFIRGIRGYKLKYELRTLKEVHNCTENIYANNAKKRGNLKYIRILFISSISILLITWINYLLFQINNIHTRSKEVRIRKVLGGSSKNLIKQFLVESIFLNLLAIIISVLLLFLVKPYFILIYGIAISVYLFYNIGAVLGLVLILFTGVFVISLYFAFVVTSIKHLGSSRGTNNATNKVLNISVQRILLIIQFTITVILIISTITIYNQIKYMENQNASVDIDRVVRIYPKAFKDSILTSQMPSFRNELAKLSFVENVSVDSDIPVGETNWCDILMLKGDQESSIPLYIMNTSPDFFNLYKIKIIKGRNFSRDINSDKNAILMNECAVQKLGLKNPQNALGKYVDYYGSSFLVIGVIQDYHNRSLNDKPDPMIYFSNWVDNKYKNNKYISVKLSCPYTGEVVSNLDRFFKKFFQGREANYDYLPDMMEKYYIEDNKLSIMFNLFTIVAIILSCVGILGVSIYDLTKRTKEIAIRKVNGASSMQILYIINLDILKYIVVSIIIGIPIAYYIMKNWLMHYPVRISIPWYVFAFAGLSVMFISLLTISFFTIKASRQNPVKTLKSE